MAKLHRTCWIGAIMNYSIATADRVTHLKIVAFALIWSIAVIAVVIAIR